MNSLALLVICLLSYVKTNAFVIISNQFISNNIQLYMEVLKLYVIKINKLKPHHLTFEVEKSW
jgi:hypothetical protein